MLEFVSQVVGVGLADVVRRTIRLASLFIESQTQAIIRLHTGEVVPSSVLPS